MKEKYGSGLWAFGQVVDRFNPRGYKVHLTTEQQLELATEVKALRGVELHYPTDFKRDEVEKVKAIPTRIDVYSILGKIRKYRTPEILRQLRENLFKSNRRG